MLNYKASHEKVQVLALFVFLCSYMNQFEVCVLGWVVSSLLAAAAIGSFTGGSLADKFGRTKTLILDAIPLTLGAFLW